MFHNTETGLDNPLLVACSLPGLISYISLPYKMTATEEPRILTYYHSIMQAGFSFNLCTQYDVHFLFNCMLT